MPRILANDIELNYDQTGSGETLVLVHGSWSDRNNWQAVVPELARSFTVVAYDRRGNGESGRAEGSRRDHEDDLAALIAALGGQAVDEVATSFGASIALGLASRRPDLVRRLIAHEPPLGALVADDPGVRPDLDRVERSLRTIFDRVRRGDAAGAAEQFVEEVALGRGAWAGMPQPLRQTMIDSAPSVVVEQRDPRWDTIEPEALARIACPLLLTQGTESPSWFAPIVAKLAGAIDHAEVHTYAGAGHAPHLTHPADFLASVTEFLSGASPVAIDAIENDAAAA